MAGDLSSVEGLADKHVRALNRLDETAPLLAEWQTAASFVVVFSQRRTGGTWERRVEAERTEVEPERATEVWSGWHPAPVCAWMADQLAQANGARTDPAGTPGIPWPWPGRGRPSTTWRRSRRATTR